MADALAKAQQAFMHVPIVYLNLDERTDRKAETEAQWRPLFPQLKRSAGIRLPGRQRGCSTSGIKTLENTFAGSPGEDIILFMEDDAATDLDPLTFLTELTRMYDELKDMPDWCTAYVAPLLPMGPLHLKRADGCMYWMRSPLGNLSNAFTFYHRRVLAHLPAFKARVLDLNEKRGLAIDLWGSGRAFEKGSLNRKLALVSTRQLVYQRSSKSDNEGAHTDAQVAAAHAFTKKVLDRFHAMPPTRGMTLLSLSIGGVVLDVRATAIAAVVGAGICGAIVMRNRAKKFKRFARQRQLEVEM